MHASRMDIKKNQTSVTSVMNDMPLINCTQITEGTLSNNNTKGQDTANTATQTKKCKCKKLQEIAASKILNCTCPRVTDFTIMPNSTKALERLLIMNQLPISFCSSVSFRNFIDVVDLEPCEENAIRESLTAVKIKVIDTIKQNLDGAGYVVCTIDCWSSAPHKSYITVKAHILNSDWNPKSYALATYEMEEGYTPQNAADELQNTLDEWEITQEFLYIVTHNAESMANGIPLLSKNTSNQSCVIQKLQLIVDNALKQANVEHLVQHCRKVVGHFKHSKVAKIILKQEQEVLNMSQDDTLLQSYSTSWNSVFFMLEQLFINRHPILNTLADPSIANSNIAEHLTITESQWKEIELLLKILKPLQEVVHCFSDMSHHPITMVRPLITQVIEKHLKLINDDDDELKTIIISELVQQFNLDMDEADNLHISSFFDPRYKDLNHEPVSVKSKIHSYVKDHLKANAKSHVANKVQQRGLKFLYNDETDHLTINAEFDAYVAEPEIRFDSNIFEWWASQEIKYPRIAKYAKIFLTIPATPITSRSRFPTTGYIPERNYLPLEDLDLIGFLYENRELLD